MTQDFLEAHLLTAPTLVQFSVVLANTAMALRREGWNEEAPIFMAYSEEFLELAAAAAGIFEDDEGTEEAGGLTIVK